MCVSSGGAHTGQQELGGAGGEALTVLETLGASQAQPPALPAVKDAAFQEGSQGVGTGEAGAAKAAGRFPINPACALASGEAVWSMRGEGVCMDSHTHVGPMNIPASSPPTASQPTLLRGRVGPTSRRDGWNQTLLRVPAGFLSGAET